MRRVLLIALLVVIVLSAVSGSCDVAKADAMLNPQPATDGLLWAAVGAADTYWTDHGQPPLCPAQVLVYTENGLLTSDGRPGALARGDQPGCHVWFERSYVAVVRRALAAHIWRGEKRWWLINLCMVAIHERGHNLGHTHEEGGVMDVTGLAPTSVPECALWAARNTPAASLNARRVRARMRSMKKVKIPRGAGCDQPKVRSHVARAAWDATGAGKHGGTARTTRRKDRQNTKRELRAGSEA